MVDRVPALDPNFFDHRKFEYLGFSSKEIQSKVYSSKIISRITTSIVAGYAFWGKELLLDIHLSIFMCIVFKDYH